MIKIRTLSFPRKEILPSTSTETEGILSITSETLPPRTVMSFPTLYTRLSRRISTSVFSAITSTSSNALSDSVSSKVPKSLGSRMTTSSKMIFSKEMYSMVTVYFPGKTAMSKLPSALVIPPCKTSGRLLFLRVMVAYSRGSWVVLSTTDPLILIF